MAAINTAFKLARRAVLVSVSLLGLIFTPSLAFALQSVSAEWNPSSDEVAGYRLYYGSASGSYTNHVSVGNVTTATVSGLVEGATYFFTVKAYGINHLEAPPSNEISYVVPQPPLISAIPTQIIVKDTSTPPIQFTLSGAQIAATNIVLSASSSNPLLVPNTNIIFGGSGSNRTVTLTPLLQQIGDADITVTVSDGTASSSTAFRLIVLTGPPKTSPGLTLITNGSGAISPNLSTKTLTPGKTYTLTAIPAKGQEFAGWTGNLISSLPKLTFVLTSNLVLEANFVPSPYLPKSGSYSGLFYEEEVVQQYSAGFFSVLVTARGTYTGLLKLGAYRHPLSGRLDIQCQATNVILRRNDRPLQIEMRIGEGDQADQILGRVTDGIWISALSGDRAVFNSKTNPAPYAGNYTLLLPGQDDDPALPAGDSFGSVRVLTNGSASFAGSLADGTKISGRASLSKRGFWPFYVPLYSGKGSLISWLAFTNRADDDLNGLLSWIKPADDRLRYYSDGFTNELAAAGSVYDRPLAAHPILNFTNAFAEFSSGNLLSNFTSLAALDLNNRVSNLSSNRFNLSFSLANGTFTGSTTDPASGKSLSFKGAVMQKLNGGYGFLLGSNRSSRVFITPR